MQVATEFTTGTCRWANGDFRPDIAETRDDCFNCRKIAFGEPVELFVQERSEASVVVIELPGIDGEHWMAECDRSYRPMVMTAMIMICLRFYGRFPARLARPSEHRNEQ